MFTERNKIVIAYAVTCLVWGSTWLVIRLGLDSLPPFLSAGLRFFVAMIVLYGLMVYQKIPNPFKSTRRWLLFLMGILSFALAFAAVYWAEQFIPSGLSSILFAVYPFFVAIFSYFILKQEPLNSTKILGIVCGFSGIVVIFYDDFYVQDGRMILGMIAVLGSTVFQSFSLIMVKKYGKEFHPIALNFGAMLIGSTVLLIMSLLFERNMRVAFTPMAIFSIFYLAIIGSVVTFVAYFWLLKRTEAVFLSLITFVTPILAVFLGALVLHEQMQSKTFLGAGIVLSGILIANSGDYFNRKTKS